MQAPLKEILQYVLDHPELTTKEAVFCYFSEVIWSIEKNEWDKLTHAQRMAFIENLDRVVEQVR